MVRSVRGEENYRELERTLRALQKQILLVEDLPIRYVIIDGLNEPLDEHSLIRLTINGSSEPLVPLPTPLASRFISPLALAILAILGIINRVYLHARTKQEARDPITAAQENAERALATVAELLPERSRTKALGLAIDALYERTADATTPVDVDRVARALARHMLATAGRAHAHNARKEPPLPLTVRSTVLIALTFSVASSLITILAFVLSLPALHTTPALAIPIALALVALSGLGGACLYKATVRTFPSPSGKDRRPRKGIE